jgi:hypothetical protein
MGDGFAGEYGLVEKDLSRGEAPICSDDTAVPWMSLRYSATTTLTACTILPSTAAG